MRSNSQVEVIRRSVSTSFAFGAAILSREVAALFPGHVVAAQMQGLADPSFLLTNEIKQVRGASWKRVKEFAAGRACARCALSELGIKDFPLLAREDRRPNWPDGIVGSITHTNDFCAAAVGRKSHCKAIGLDAEQVCGITPDLYPYICTAEEHDRLSSMNPRTGARTAALIFSTKEAFYKCQYALTEEFLDFQDIQLDIDTINFKEGRCMLSPTRDIILTRYVVPPYGGRFYFHKDLIVSGFQFTEKSIAIK